MLLLYIPKVGSNSGEVLCVLPIINFETIVATGKSLVLALKTGKGPSGVPPVAQCSTAKT